jgi:hypothetical protein
MHFHLFPPPPMHLMPIFLAAGIALAAGALAMRRGLPNLRFRFRRLLPQRLNFRHRGPRSGLEREGPEKATSNAAFAAYRAATIARLESEARDFRAFLERLRRSSDAADFQAFLRSRRETAAPR